MLKRTSGIWLIILMGSFALSKSTIIYQKDHRNAYVKLELIDPEPNQPQSTSSSLDKAWHWLEQNAARYGIESDLSDFSLRDQQESLLGYHFHFQQRINGIDISRAEIVVSLSKRTGQVYLVHNNSFPVPIGRKNLHEKAKLNETQAYDLAWNHLKVHGEIMAEPKQKLVYVPNGYDFRLVFLTDLAVEAPFGYWRHQIDAQTGEIIDVKSRAISNKSQALDLDSYQGPIDDRKASFKRWEKTQAKKQVRAKSAAAGTAMLWETDPRTVLGDGSLQDSSPASAFTAAYSQKILQDISLINGSYRLNGPWVQIVNFESPNTAPSTTKDGNWTAARGNNAFNDAMAYYTIDRSQRYIQSLGFDSVQANSIQVDTDGVGGEDNSYYIPGENRIAYGHGCVDDSEESFTILHEYGHAIHMGINYNWDGGDTGAMGEGFGDYWAGSHRYSTTEGQSFNPNWAFPWVGHNSCWEGRSLNNTQAQYDPNQSYPAHEIVNGADGDELWSTPLFQSLVTLMGQGVPRKEVDQIMLQSLYGTSANMTMREMATLIVNTANQLFPDGPHAAVLTEKFSAQNILSGGSTGGGGGGDTGGGDTSGGTLVKGQAVTLNGAQDSQTFYTFEVPNGATQLSFVMSGGSGDADIYVRYGSKPTLSQYDFRPYEIGNNETVTVSSPQSGTWHVMIHGYEAFQNVSLTANYQEATGGGGGGTSPSGELSKGQTITIDGAQDSQTYYTFNVPQDAGRLSFVMNGGSGDADIYVRYGSKPTQTQFDYRPYEFGNDETVTISNPQAGTWHVMVHGYESYRNVSLTADYQDSTTGGGGQTHTDTFTGNVRNVKYHTIDVSGGTIKLVLTWEKAATDVDLTLYDPDGFEVDFSYFDNPEIIEYNATGNPGLYTIEVYKYSGQRTNYTVTATYQ